MLSLPKHLYRPNELDFSNQPDGLYFLRGLATGTVVKVTKAMTGKAQ